MKVRKLKIGVAALLGIVANVMPATASEVDQELPTMRAHAALVVAPEGWKRSEMAGGPVTFAAPEAGVSIIVAAPMIPRPSLKDQMEADLQQGRQNNHTFQPEGNAIPGRHPSGYETLTQRASFDKGGFQLRPTRAQLLITHIDGGAEVSSQPVLFLADNPELFERNFPAYAQFIKDLRLPSRVELAPGPAGRPPLTLYTVQQVGDFLEWLMESPFTGAQRDALQAYLVDAYKRGDVGEIDGLKQVHDVRKQLDALDADRRQIAREAGRAEAMKQWRKDAKAGDRMAKMMVDLYDVGHEPLARGEEGDPPLTRQSADAALEAVYFMASKVADPNGTVFRPTAKQLDEWAKDLVASYKQMPLANKEDLAGMPTIWATLRLAWPELSSTDRTQVLEVWAQMPLVKQTAEQIKAKRPAEDEARRLAQIYRAHDAHRQLINMGAYRLHYRPAYIYGR